MSTAPSSPLEKSLWSIQMWWENIWTLSRSSVAPEIDRLRTMMWCTAFAGGDVTSCIPSVEPVGSVMVPETWMTYRPAREM